MRILTVSAYFETHGGGIEIVAGALARALGALGHDSRLAAAEMRDDIPYHPAFTAIPLPASDPMEASTGLPMPLPGPTAWRRLREEVKAADAVIIHDALYVSSLAGRYLARRYGKPWVLIQHIGKIPYKNVVMRGLLGMANRLVTRRLLSRAGQVVFISAAVRDHFRDVRFAAAPMVMFNGVDSTVFAMRDAAARSELRRRLEMSGQRPQLLFVGRFVQKKGLAVLKRVARSRPDCDLLMVGKGPIDPRTWDCPNVRVLGRKTASELAELYNAADVMVLPSAGEGFPLVVQEAMACGLPIVCGRDSVSADPEASSFLTGIDVDLSDPDGSARRLMDALPGAMGTDGAAVAAYAARAYRWDANAERIAGCLRRLISAA
jgi:glycosyltransferase involved in cell wall biosynthesis